MLEGAVLCQMKKGHKNKQDPMEFPHPLPDYKPVQVKSKPSYLTNRKKLKSLQTTGELLGWERGQSHSSGALPTMEVRYKV